MMLFLSLFACLKYGPVQYLHGDVLVKLETAEKDPWTKICAPEEMALAGTNKEFAEIEFQQGSVIRSEEHLRLAITNVDEALRLADECRPKDIDGDKIMDNVDQCPKEPETYNDYQDEDGCPEKDSDHDTIYDDVDACITVPEDMDDFEDEDGCPEYDNDKDGVVDLMDKCPLKPEDYDGYQDEDGCPEETGDTDGDGIYDDVDMCIRERETLNEYMDADGCPDEAPRGVRVTETSIEITEKIYFETGKAVILPKSYDILNSVAQAMVDYSNIQVEVQGHTDSDGSAAYNLGLSDKRALAVKTYLMTQGVESNRLESKGYGEGAPIATNETAEGKEENRRVEFRIISGMGE